jgi:hypothetical protein
VHRCQQEPLDACVDTFDLDRLQNKKAPIGRSSLGIRRVYATAKNSQIS